MSRRWPRRMRSGFGWFVGQVALIGTGVVVYFGVRGLTAGSPATAQDHAEDVVGLERALRLYVEPGVQAAVAGSGLTADAANWVYIWGHWPVIAAAFGWLALRHRRVYARLRDAMLASGAAGLVVFAAYPLAPPRLAGLGLVDTVTERSNAYRVLQPPAFVNQYAAMPSLHVGWDLLVGIAVASAAGAAWLRWLGRLMPALMTVAVVATANHFVVDVAAGALFGLAGLAVALWLESWRAPRARPPAPPPALILPGRLPGQRRPGDEPARPRGGPAR